MTDSEYRANSKQAAGRTRICHAGSGHQQSYFVFRLLWAMARGTGSARQMRRLGALTLFAGLSLLYVYWNAGYYRMVPLFFAVVRRVFPPSARQQRFDRHETENQNLHVPQEDR